MFSTRIIWKAAAFLAAAFLLGCLAGYATSSTGNTCGVGQGANGLTCSATHWTVQP